MDNAPIISSSPGEVVPSLTEHEVEVVRERRASLRRAGAAVRAALRAPGGDPAPSGAVLAVVRDLARVWASHILATEDPDGMLAQILLDSSRLAPEVGRLRREHAGITDTLGDVDRLLGQAGPDAPVDPVTALPALHRLLDAVDRHRLAGRKLIYDAYQVDLGLGE